MGTYKHKRTGKFIAQRYDSRLKKKVQLGTFATLKEANRALREYEDRHDVDNPLTVRAWRSRWLDNEHWKESTREHNRERTVKFVERYGDARMDDIDRLAAREWVGHHPSSFGPIAAMFGAAVYHDVIKTNPFHMLVRRKAVKRDLQPDWLTEADIAGLERAAITVHGPTYGPSFAAMIRFAAETGIRPGELYVVEDDDLDVAGGRLYVRRAADSKTRVVTTPKNGEAREVVLSKRAAEAAQRAIRWEGVDRIFSTPTGKQFWAPNMSWLWKPVKCAAGKPTMDWYELRHWCATRLLDMGLADNVVAVQLGHQDGGDLVRRVYGHPNQRRALRELREAMDTEVV